MKEKNNGNTIFDIFIFLAVLLAVTAIWYFLWQWIDTNVMPANENETLNSARGQFGDKFGAANALFSGFAFAGIIITLLLQRRDLAETRQVMSHERFDNTFFQLVNLHIDITKNITARGRNGIDACDAFNTYLLKSDPDFPTYSALRKIPRDEVRIIIDKRHLDSIDKSQLSEADITNLTESLSRGVSAFSNYLDDDQGMHEKKIVDGYKKAAAQYIDYFSHYFRNLYHILKYIDTSDLISEKEKKSYSTFLRSQLSDVELVCIFYNSISKIELQGRENMELGYPKMRKLLEQFDILQNMNPLSVIHPAHLHIFKKNNGK
jgi:hypothetical protein